MNFCKILQKLPSICKLETGLGVPR